MKQPQHQFKLRASWFRNILLLLAAVLFVTPFWAFHCFGPVESNGDIISANVNEPLTVVSKTKLDGENKNPPKEIHTQSTPENHRKVDWKRLLELATLEKEQTLERMKLSTITSNSTDTVLVVSPIGNTTNLRKDYKVGTDDTLVLECTLLHHQYPRKLIRATFDDSDGYNSLDIRKVKVVHHTLHRLLHQEALPATTLIVVVDAFDVMFQKTPMELLNEYTKQPYPIVFGGELACWDPISGDVHGNISTPFCSFPREQREMRPSYFDASLNRMKKDEYYLNSGVYMSTLGTLVRFLDFVLYQQPLPTVTDGLAPWPGTVDQFNDQAFWSYWYVKYHPLIGLDTPPHQDQHKSSVGRTGLALIANIGKNRKKRTFFENGTYRVRKMVPGILHFPGHGAKEFSIYITGKKYYQSLCTTSKDGTLIAAR